MNRQVFVLIASCLVVSGCAQEKFEVKNPFPSRQEVVQLAAKSVSSESVAVPEVSVVETWELHGPLPEKIGYRPHTPQNAVEEAFYSGLGSDQSELTGSEAMHCAARETGYFVLEHEKLPYDSLKSFIYARCGVLASEMSVQWRTRPGATEQDGVGFADAAAKSMVQTAASSEQKMDSGFWYGEKGDQVAFVSTAGRVLVDLRPTPMRVGADQKVVLEGRVLLPDMDEIFALINRGDYDYRRCKHDPTVEMPTFRITCPVAAADDIAYFQVMAATETSIMARTVIQQLVWPGGELSNVYRSPATRRALKRAKLASAQQASQLAGQETAGQETAGQETAGQETASAGAAAGDQADADEADSDDAEANKAAATEEIEPLPLAQPLAEAATKGYPARFVSLLNQVRREAKMEPVEHAEGQSAVIQSVTEQWFAEDFGEDEEAANKLAMGILAGWDVGGAIIDAGLASDWTSGDDPSQLLETMLESPNGRQTLMDPAVSEVSLGSLDHANGTGGVVASYSFVPDEHPNRRVKRVLDSLSEQREAFGSLAAKEDPRLRSTARKLSKHIAAGNVGILEARDELLEAASERYRKPVYGYALVAHSLETIDFPNDLLTSKNLPVSVVVAPFTKKGHPWTLYAVVVVIPVQPKANLASLDH